MRIAIASHIVLDSLEGLDKSVTSSAGGPPCYAGLTCRRFGFDVVLATKVGRDLPESILRLLSEEKIFLEQTKFVDSPTTRFSITADNESRRMVIQARCEQLATSDVENIKADCWLVSPVFDEVPPGVLGAIKSNAGTKKFVMLDPQGYMRSADKLGNVTATPQKIDLDLAGIRAIKVDQDEMRALTGGHEGLQGMRDLQSRGIEFIVSTMPDEIHLLHKETHYWAKIRHIDAADSTGAGDILAGAFCCAYIKEKDPLWALCFGAGAVRAALETGEQGLNKVPSFSRIEENASYLYNTIGFKKLS